MGLCARGRAEEGCGLALLGNVVWRGRRGRLRWEGCNAEKVVGRDGRGARRAGGASVCGGWVGVT